MGAQSLSSVTNFVIVALALSAGALDEFGRFSIVFQLCLVVIAVGQGSLGNIALIHSDQSDAARGPVLSSGLASMALLLGMVLGLGLAVAGLALGGEMRLPLLLAAVGSPALVAQYCLRAGYFARGRPQGALIADAAWLGVVLAVAAVDVSTGWEPSTNAYLAAWLAGAVVGGAPAIGLGLRFRRSDLIEVWRATGPQTIRLGAEGMLARSVFVVTLIWAGILVGDDASGSLAAAVVVFSPLTVVHTSSLALVVPGEVRRRGIHVVRRSVPFQVGGSIMVVSALWGLLLWIFDVSGFSFGPFDLDASEVTLGLFLATLVRFLAMAAWRGPITALLIADAAGASLETRFVGTVVQWSLPAVGFAWWGVEGGAWALAVATWVGAAVAWRRYEKLRIPAG
ncbi:MAG: hypothetical protein RIB98_19485 [Acidimicrobiales bacterium]